MKEGSVRQRAASATNNESDEAKKKNNSNTEEEAGAVDGSLRRSPSLARRAVSQTLTSTATLANLLPTGTLLAFQMLTPVFTNNGSCDSVTRLLTLMLLLLLGLSSFLACFTDTVKASDGRVYHGLATFTGLWLFDHPEPDPSSSSSSGLPDLSKYKVRLLDWVHALLSVLVFCSVALRDKNVVTCFYGPKPEHETQEVLNIVPVGIGVLSSLLFVVFPTTRHGIGYPLS